jgi:hypothetical protein
VRSQATQRFWRLFANLPEDVQRLATKNYRLWRQSPSHPSLHFRALQGQPDLFTVRIGSHYRALGVQKSNSITWTWIGTHAEYEQLIRG